MKKKPTDVVVNSRERMLIGIKNYVAADRSDPFAYSRCMTHLRQGLCAPLKDGADGMYNAKLVGGMVSERQRP